MAVQREQVVQTAEKYVARGKIEPAIREYRKLLTDNPNDINTLNRIGDLYARIQKIDEAVDFFTQIAEQYSTEGFFVKAIAIYKKIIKLDPTRLEVYEKLADLYHKQGLVNEARTQYQVLADYYQKHDNAASAIAIFQKMADLEPSNPTYHVKLAEIYQAQQLTEKAVNEYRVIAEMMIAHGRSQDAAHVYERALDIDSSNVNFIKDAVFKLKESGNTAAAARFLAIAGERNPQASRLGRLAQVEEEPEVEATPEPAPPPPVAAPAPPPAAYRPAPAPPPVRQPEPEPGPPPQAFSLGSFDDEEDPQTQRMADLAAAMREAEASPAATFGPARSAKPAEPAEEEIELDLDEAFVLDMDADDEPSSLVKPPPDMAGEGLRLGSAWTRDDDSGPATASFPEVEMEIDLGEVETAPPAAEAFGAFDSFESVELPPLETSGEITLELEEPDLPQFDSNVWTLETEDLPPALEEEPSYAQPVREIDPDVLERTAAELNPEKIARDEDLVSEAEVLAKYGLEEKALERLREALRIQPRNLNAHATLVQIHLDKARHDRVAELANAMARTAAEVQDTQGVWPAMRRQLQEAGYRLDGDRVVATPLGLLEPPAPAPVPEPEPVEPEPVFLEPELELAFEEEPVFEPEPVFEAAPEPPAPPPPPPPVEVAPPPPAIPLSPAAKKKSAELDQMVAGLLGTAKPKKPVAPRPAPAAPAPPPAPVAAAPPVAAPVVPEPQPAPPPPDAAPPAPSSPIMFNPLEIGEMIEREDDLGWEPPSALPPLPPPPAQSAPQQSTGSLGHQPSLDDTGGLSWLDEADRKRPGKAAASESLFDEEDDFFDLAAELEQELSQDDLFPGAGSGGMVVQQAEQSLEEIVEGFKKGVAEHLSPTDFDTHFNLGIAYREMGLLDEAIGEFQVAAKDPGHLVLCCSMLGLCFLDKGLPELAVKWYRRGLEAPGIVEEDHLGLLYDLGCAYLTLDDKASAYSAFVELYGINTHYRDVVARIEELGR